jgi:acyl carrier protein
VVVGRTAERRVVEPIGLLGHGQVDPITRNEELLAEVLGDVLGVERVSLDGHFFDDMGADSMVMARFCARLRNRSGVSSISMKDVYRNPTIRSLAAALDTAPASSRPAPIEATTAPDVQKQPGTGRRAGYSQYILCGAQQLLIFLGFCYGTALVLTAGYGWISAGAGPLEIYLRSAAFGGGTFLAACIVPIAAKWLLVGRWTRREIRIWSPGYVRSGR